MDTQDRAVQALCLVIEYSGHPTWIVSTKSGIRPEDIADKMPGDIVYTNDINEIEIVPSYYEREIVSNAVEAVSCYVRWSCKE